jgi:hypothetical protein
MPVSIRALRKLIQEDVFDYQTLIATLANYSSPRDKISRLIRNGDIIRIKKGLYIFSDDLRRKPISLMYLANLIHGPSYVSLEYALQHYTLLPERVTEITSVTTSRSRRYTTPVGHFSFQHIPLSCFTTGMDIFTDDSGNSCLIAVAEKALVDKINAGPQLRTNKDMKQYLFDDLRLNASDLQQLSIQKVEEYCTLYGSKKNELLLQVVKNRAFCKT